MDEREKKIMQRWYDEAVVHLLSSGDTNQNRTFKCFDVIDFVFDGWFSEVYDSYEISDRRQALYKLGFEYRLNTTCCGPVQYYNEVMFL